MQVEPDASARVDPRLEPLVRLLVDQVAHAIIVSDSSGEVVLWNRAATALFGYSAKEVLGRHVLPMIASEEIAAEVRRTIAGLEPGHPFIGEVMLQDRHGTELPTLLALDLVRDAGSGEEFVVGSSLDLTATPDAVEEARRLAAVLRTSTAGVVTVDTDGIVTWANPATEELTGWAPEELIGRSAMILVPPHLVEQAIEVEKACLEGEEIPPLEVQTQCRDGTVKDVMLTMSSYRDVRGRIRGASTMIWDVTEAKRMKAALESVSRSLRARFDQVSLPQGVLGLDGTIIEVNDAFCALTGRDRDSCLGHLIDELAHTMDTGELHAALALLGEGAAVSATDEWVGAHADGQPLPLLVDLTVLHDSDDAPTQVALFARDLREVKEARRRLSEVESLFQALSRNSSEAAVVADARGMLRFVSPSTAHSLGYEPADLVSTDVYGLIHPEDHPATLSAVHAILRDPDGLSRRRLRVRSRSGEWRWMELALTNYLGDPDIRGLVANLTDITAERAAADELQHRALHDGLTGLPNRTLLSDRLRVAAARQNRGESRGTAVLVLDIDHLKMINDSWGHDLGDRIVAEVGHRVRQAVREADIVGRLGGDEFAVILEDVDPTTAREVAGEVQSGFSVPFEVGGQVFYVSASSGIAHSPPHHHDDLLRFADVAMYRAKSDGRGGCVVFDHHLAHGARRRLDVQTAVGQALTEDTIGLHYQPVVDLATNEVHGAEALLRWTHPTLGTMSPPEVVSSAEDSGRFVDLDRVVLRRACHEMGGLVSNGVMPESSYVSVNISASTVSSIHFDRLVLDSLATSDLRPHQLVIEVTESAIMRDPARAISSLRNLTAHGIRVAIDDFGTGYSSMAYLQRLPLDVLKIDRLFVHNVTADPASQPILRSIAGLAEALGLHSIAEGIETAEQAAAVRALGCRSGQGFLWSGAVPASELPARLRRIADSAASDSGPVRP